MLSLLHIENIALIELAEIQFGAGFNVLTGETGAGKSIVVDTINAVLGERTSRDLVRTGAKSALVTAIFTDFIHLPWLEENGLQPDGDELLIQREIRADGKNTCRINGKLVTVSQLRQLGQQLLNIHGQHDGQQLLDPTCHLSYLDHFGRTGAELSQFQQQYQALSQLRERRRKLEMDESERSRKVDTLSFQIQELERAELRAGEDGELNERRKLLRSAGKLMDAIQSAFFALNGDEEQNGACALISDAESQIRTVSDLSSELEDLKETLSNLRCAADEVAELLRDMERGLDSSPNELDQIEGRLDVLYRLKKKYGPTVADMLDYLERSREELNQIEGADDLFQQLSVQLEQRFKTAKASAEVLSASRKQAADALRRRVEEELRHLNMSRVQFQVEFAPKAGESGMDETGMDQVQFLMSANLGEDLKPIQKVASGGELARIMLALKNVLAEDDGIHSLVFDEVDTGVSGQAAQKVAEKMASLAQHKQVLCVTHLPQIAAMADCHLKVEKGERDGRTYTNVEPLDREGRRMELARLFGGACMTKALLHSAEELLAQADTYKSRR